MKYCEKCDYPIFDDSTYCPKCGTKNENNLNPANTTFNVDTLEYCKNTSTSNSVSTKTKTTNTQTCQHTACYVFYIMFLIPAILISVIGILGSFINGFFSGLVVTITLGAPCFIISKMFLTLSKSAKRSFYLNENNSGPSKISYIVSSIGLAFGTFFIGLTIFAISTI